MQPPTLRKKTSPRKTLKPNQSRVNKSSEERGAAARQSLTLTAPSAEANRKNLRISHGVEQFFHQKDSQLFMNRAPILEYSGNLRIVQKTWWRLRTPSSLQKANPPRCFHPLETMKTLHGIPCPYTKNIRSSPLKRRQRLSVNFSSEPERISSPGNDQRLPLAFWPSDCPRGT